MNQPYCCCKASQSLSHYRNHKLFFDNWFTTLPLLKKPTNMVNWVVGTIRSNLTQICLLQPNKNLQKNGRRVALDYWVDHNSGVVVVKWMDNKVVELALNFVRVEPMSTWVQWWDKVTTSKKAIPWFQAVIAYNKSMGVVDLANMILALCRIPVTIKR